MSIDGGSFSCSHVPLRAPPTCGQSKSRVFSYGIRVLSLEPRPPRLAPVLRLEEL